MERQERINHILDREWNMFQNVQNVGGRASCQEDERSLRIMRGAQFSAWSDEMLASYQQDLMYAEAAGHNLLSEKYGYMMQATFPAEYERIKDLLPPISPEKKQLIDEILAIQIDQTRKFRMQYPNLGRNGRPLTAAEDAQGTSVETYTRGELSTYSLETLQAHLRHLRDLEQRGILFPQLIMEATVRLSGYQSLEEAERLCRR